MMRLVTPTRIDSLRAAPPARRDLASGTTSPLSFSIEKHFVLPLILYAAYTFPLPPSHSP